MAGGCGNAGRTRVRQAGEILEGHEYLQPHNNNDAARSNAAGTIHGARAALNVGTGFPLLRAYAAKSRGGYFESMRGNLLRRKVNQICRTIKVRFSEKTVEVNTEKQIADLTASMVRIDGSARVRDEKGRDVFWKFENGMSYTGFADAALSNELMRVMPGAVERLILDKDIIPKNPCGKETRHPAHSQPTDKEKFGTLHLGVWANRYKTSLGLTGDTRQTSDVRAVKVANFYRDMGPAFQVIGQLFKAIDPDSFRRYEAIWEALAQRGGLGNIQSSNWQVFSTIALVHELTVGPHMDDGDLGDGWAAMFVRGVFSGGDLVVPALGMKFPYKQGDLVFMRSSELEHYIDKWEGCRTGAVMFTKVTTVEKLHEEIKKMLEQMKDEEVAAEAKKEDVAAEAKKEDVAVEAKQEDVAPSAKAKDEEAATPFATGAKEEDAIADVHTRQAKRKSSPDETPSTTTRRLRSRTVVYTSKS